MALKIVKQNEVLTKESINVLLYGFPGLGKTSLSQTSERSLLLDFDNGVERAVNRQDVLKISSWADIEELMKENIILKEKYKTVIIDTVGTALDDYLSSYVISQDPKNKKRGGGLSLAGYGAMKDVFKIFYDYLKSINIFIAHLTEKQEGDESVLRPKITGGTYDIIVAKCDQMGYMYIDNKVRRIEFQPIDRAVGKDAAGIGNIEFPHYEKPEYSTFMHDSVLQMAKDAIKTRNEKALEYQKILADEKIDVAELKTVQEINNKIKLLLEYDHVPEGILKQIKYLVADRAKDLGFQFNKDSNEYEDQDKS